MTNIGCVDHRVIGGIELHRIERTVAAFAFDALEFVPADAVAQVAPANIQANHGAVVVAGGEICRVPPKGERFLAAHRGYRLVRPLHKARSRIAGRSRPGRTILS